MSWIRKWLGKRGAEQPDATRSDATLPNADGPDADRPAAGADKRLPVATITLPVAEPGRLYQDQVLRKEWAEGVLREHGVRINPHLPCIEGEAETLPRSLADVAGRLLALTIVALKGEGMPQEQVRNLVDERGAAGFFSPRERMFIDDPDPDEHTRIQFCWRYEAAWVMQWALRFTGAPLSFPDGICDVAVLVQTMRDTPDLTVHGMQSTNNLLNEADLVYRCHWAVRQASLDGDEPTGGLMAGVVLERHHALNWLIGQGDQAWDDISTDT